MSRSLENKACIFAALLLCTFCSPAAAAMSEASSSRNSRLGIELGLLGSPEDVDCFAAAASGGLEFERQLSFLPALSAGVWLDAAGFRARDTRFGQSFMYCGGAEIGWSFQLSADGADASLILEPLLRGGWYFRNIIVDNSEYWGSRPFAALGLRALLGWDSAASGLSLYAAVPLDETPVVLIWLTESVSLRI